MDLICAYWVCYCSLFSCDQGLPQANLNLLCDLHCWLQVLILSLEIIWLAVNFLHLLSILKQLTDMSVSDHAAKRAMMWAQTHEHGDLENFSDLYE